MKIGPYEVQGELGRGGMGVVYRGRASSGFLVAIKLLARLDREQLARFERERRLLGTFTAREGFVPLLDAGTSAEGPYLVMPLVPGGTLRDRLARGPLGIEETEELGRRLAGALGRAHEKGIVHRDLKPENVLFDAEGQPLIADLGLAKHFDRDAPGASQSVSLSRHGVFRGTPAYAAPEQVNDAKSVGPAADVFALGAILYECLAGKPAFSGENVLEVVTRIESGEKARLRSERPDVPARLDRIVERCLSPEAGARYADGLAVCRALEGGATRSHRPAIRLVIVALAVTAAAAGIAILRRTRDEPAPVRAPPPVEPRLDGGPKLPDGLRLGPTIELDDGTKVQVYLSRLPGNGGDMELVRVPAGDFLMGTADNEAYANEKPQHVHPVDHAYWIGRNDVTWKQYLAYCAATNAPEPERPAWAQDEHPVVNVSWVDAQGFCAWAKLVLPGEVEWEKAARGTDGRRYPWGDTWDGSRCNHGLDPKGGEDPSDGYANTSPAGAYPAGASPYGALDMAGNVWQWCQDSYDETSYKRYKDGDLSPPTGGSNKVLRGGCWIFSSLNCRTSNRIQSEPDYRKFFTGFRVALR